MGKLDGKVALLLVSRRIRRAFLPIQEAMAQRAAGCQTAGTVPPSITYSLP